MGECTNEKKRFSVRREVVENLSVGCTILLRSSGRLRLSSDVGRTGTRDV